jgi:hypothetical protein
MIRPIKAIRVFWYLNIKAVLEDEDWEYMQQYFTPMGDRLWNRSEY